MKLLKKGNTQRKFSKILPRGKSGLIQIKNPTISVQQHKPVCIDTEMFDSLDCL